MQVKINLNNPPTADKINVDLQWRVQVTSPKGGLFAKLFRKHNRVSRDVRITVSDIIVPQDIVCDKNNLFSILYGDKLYSQSEFPVEAHINDMAQPFQLLFHQAEIKDCIKPQDENPRSYSIHFTVNLTDLKGKVIDSVKEKIDIVFDPLGVKPHFAFDIDNEAIQYSASLFPFPMIRKGKPCTLQTVLHFFLPSLFYLVVAPPMTSSSRLHTAV